MSKTIAILCSPRKNGNSTILARKAIEGIKASGGICEEIYLNAMNIKPCIACDYCRRGISNTCVASDDMQKIYPKLLEADAILLASPIYMFNVSAQLKLFQDRCYAVPQALKGKRIGAVLTYAGEDEYDSGAINAINALKDEYIYSGSVLVGIVHGTADAQGEIVGRSDLMEQAFRLGKSLAE